jgi:hypothetical protein
MSDVAEMIGGRIDIFKMDIEGGWQPSTKVDLPLSTVTPQRPQQVAG